MIKAKELIFRKPTADDIDQLLVLKNDEESALLLGGVHSEYSREDIARWIEFHNGRNDELVLVVEDSLEDKLIGHVGLYKIDTIARKTEYGILIADKDYKGRGIGTLCTRTITNYAFNELGMHKVTAEVLTENKASVAMFTKCGYTIDGTLRDDVYKNGRYYDVYAMSILKDEFAKM